MDNWRRQKWDNHGQQPPRRKSSQYKKPPLGDLVAHIKFTVLLMPNGKKKKGKKADEATSEEAKDENSQG